MKQIVGQVKKGNYQLWDEDEHEDTEPHEKEVVIHSGLRLTVGQYRVNQGGISPDRCHPIGDL